MARTPSLILFGPQTPRPTTEQTARLRSHLLNKPELAELSNAIKDLPRLWDGLVEQDARLAQVPGADALATLRATLIDGAAWSGADPPPAIVATPLTVIIHAIQYLDYAEHEQSHEETLASIAQAGVQGFCTGFLSATALAYSKDLQDFQRRAAAALRLAVCIGAYVDLDEAAHRSVSLALRWKSENSLESVSKVLEAHADTYVSVVSDASAATATVPKAAAETVMQQLAEHGIAAKQIALTGRFHNSVHAEHVERLVKFCEQRPELQLAGAGERARVPLRTNIDGEEIGNRLPHEAAMRSLLMEQAAWYRTVERALDALPQRDGATALAVGLVECVPRAIQEQGVRVYALEAPAYALSGDAIAVVGVSGRFPGAASVDEFWRSVVREGASLVRDLPASRFDAAGLRRMLKRGSYRGCFIDDADVFDARFFGVSAREAASMDPQQRLFLQVAYEAAVAGGLLDETLGPRLRDVGCWVGVGSVDYDDNVGSHQPTAFSALGTLRAFVGGRVNHFFGWTGPSVTIDTACSSSAVAIHTACAALQARECSAALAGGVNVITSPRLYQNLGAASFLSPRGVSTAFDAAADGYGRGEGAGVVVLKRLSDALAAGDDVLAVIAGSGVGQNTSDSPITVPNASSQARLFRRVAARAGIAPGDVTYVEAHGTGTPVGDPIELASVREVFGGANRTHTLHIGSVKANIGHAEAASGAAGLIKTILMIQHGVIPPLAGFLSLNPRIPPLAASRMAIPQAASEWGPGFRAACINNYGAAGSNAALLVCQPPRPRIQSSPSRILSAAPISLVAHSQTSLRAQAAALARSLDRNLDISLSDLAAALARRQDHSLPLLWASTVSSKASLRAQLTASLSSAVNVPSQLPAILVFGGQSAPAVGLAEPVYRESPVLRKHVDRCDALLRELHDRSLFPAIFQREPIYDLVTLHAGLFALQYASAMAWMECGILPKAVIGHSFGQTTALCVSGALSLEHAMRLVAGRASLMQAHWGTDNGAMLAIEADEAKARALAARSGVDVACFNGPDRHVVAGTTEAVAALEAELARQDPPVRATRVRITHAYHCRLADAITPQLKTLTESLVFKTPVIPLETCSAGSSWGSSPTAQLVAEQTRQPVFFGEAVQRLSDRLGPCLWLEAGADTPVVRIARSALGTSAVNHRFHAVSLASHSDPLHALADATAALWRAGQSVRFWPLHGAPAARPASVVLPPYQFDKSHHWLEFKESFGAEEKSAQSLPQVAPAAPQLLSLASRDGKTARFTVDPRSDEFALCVSGHAVLGNSLCPASLYLELATRAAATLMGGDSSSLISRVTDLDIRAPLGLDARRAIALRLDRVPGSSDTWRFSLSSGTGSGSGPFSEHAAGVVQLQPADSAAVTSDFARYSRLVRASRCEELLTRADVESLRGAVVYKVFSDVVDYAPYYRGVTAVAARGHEVAGAVEVPAPLTPLKNHQCDPIAIDNFLQVAGLHINSLNQIPEGQVFVCTQVQQIQLGPAFRRSGTPQQSWLVFSNVDRVGAGNEAFSDIFVFDSDTKTLALTILGVRFTQVAISSLTKVLSRTNSAASAARKSMTAPQPAPATKPAASKPQKRRPSALNNLASVQKLLQEVVDIPAEEVTENSALDDLGIDSLMATELLGEIKDRFGVQISAESFQQAQTIASLCQLIGPDEDATSSGTCSSDSESSSYVESGQTTPEPVPGDDGDDILAELGKLVASHLGVDTLSMDMTIGDAGIDSLLSMELCSDIERIFGSKVDPSQMMPELTFEGLAKLIAPHSVATIAPSAPISPPTSSTPKQLSAKPAAAALDSTPTISFSASAAECFAAVRGDYDIFAAETGFENFRTVAYPRQAELVATYVIEAFEQLDCSLSACKAGERLPPVPHISKHDKVMNQFYALLEEAGLVTVEASGPVRTAKPCPTTPSSVLFERILKDFPQHVWEHKLLNTTGSKLADCLSGKVDPIHLIFGDKESKRILENVYTHAPMFESGTMLLAKFLAELFGKYSSTEPIRILELGAGTGGTTKFLVERLVRLGVSFTYTFTDLSPSLVAAAKRKFAQHDCMQYMVVDIEKTPPEHLLGQYHIVISTNCIHATESLVDSTTNIRKTLRPDGILCLVELTRNLFWFDLVFGLIEGWWLFNDGRKHVLAHESFWESSLTQAGFKHVDWSNGDSVESDQLRVILGCASPGGKSTGRENISMETVPFKETDSNTLYADVYYPAKPDPAGVQRPIALMIHGGGHVMLSRKDIRPRQTQLMLDAGLLPVSVDYRLCPEMTLPEGPMADVRDAFAWARQTLPNLPLQRSDIHPDGDKVVAVGWSTGGTLALSLGWTAPKHGLAAPDAILTFYCPWDYEDSFWNRPNIPQGSGKAAAALAPPSSDDNSVLEGVQPHPITAYNVPKQHGAAIGGWLSPADPRSRIALHMNWKGRTLHALLRGAQGLIEGDELDPQLVQNISPLAQIRNGAYANVPTFVVHPYADDLIPWQQAQRAHDALVERGVEARLELVGDCAVHLFDLYGKAARGEGELWGIVVRGYEFLAKRVGLR